MTSADSMALTAAERVEETETFRAVNAVALGPAKSLVYEIQYTLRFRDAAYSRDTVVGLVPGTPHLMSPGDQYRVLDAKVYASMREASEHDWSTQGLGELLLYVRYVPGTERVLSAELMIDASDDDELHLQVMPADRSLLASLPR